MNPECASGTALVMAADADRCQRWAQWLTPIGLTVHTVADHEALWTGVRSQTPVLVMGTITPSLLSELRAFDPLMGVLVVEDPATLEGAVAALQAGASDYLVAPLLTEALLQVSVSRALKRRELTLENQRYREQLEAANAQLADSLALLEYDQQAGRQVQMKLLPPTPHDTNGLLIHHYLKPSLFLSGDFVDYFSVGPHRTAFYLADVSGHGASSAFVTVFLKTLTNRIRRHFEKRTSLQALSPARIMAAMNEELLALGTGKHLTVFCGLIDVERNLLMYGMGGHYPPPVLVNDGVVRVLTGEGLPLGLFPDATYEETTVALSSRFSLVALSDGILEVLPQAGLAEKEDFLSAVAGRAQGQWPVLVHELGIDRMPSDLPDDIAVLMIQRDA